MTDESRSFLVHYAGVLLFTALAVLFRWLLDPWLGSHLVLVTLYVSVAIIVWLGGCRPAALGVLLGYIACNILFIEPRGAFSLDRPRQVLNLLGYLLACAIIVGFGEAMRVARRRAADNQTLLETEAARRQKAEEDLQKANRRAAIVLESITDAHFMLDRDWRIVALNANAERYFGRPREELLGQVIWELFPKKGAVPFEKRYREAMATGTPVHFDILSPFTGRWVDVHAYPSAEGLWIFFRDITEKKQAEASLREASLHLQLATEAAQVGTWYWNIGSDEVIWSELHKKLWGVDASVNSLSCEDWTSAIVPEDRERVERVVQECLQGKAEYEMEYRIVPKNSDQRRWIRSVGQVEYDEQGQPIAMRGVSFDITARKEAEEALRASERRSRLLASLSDATRTLCEPREVMRAGMRVLCEHLQADRCVWVTVEDDQDHFTFAGSVLAEGAPEVEGRFSSNEWFGVEGMDRLRRGQPFVWNGEPDGSSRYEALERMGIRAMIAVPLLRGGRVVAGTGVHSLTPRAWTDEEIELVREVSERCWESIERAKGEQAVREGERRFRELADSVPVHIWMVDAQGRLVTVNARCLEYAGLPLEAVQGDRWVDVVHPEDRQRYLAEYQRAIDARSVLRAEARLRRYDGTYRWFEIIGRPNFEGDRFMGHVGISLDVTDRRQAQEALRASEARFRRTFECNMVPMGIWTKDGRLLDANDALLELIGYSHEDLQAGLRWIDLTPPEYHALDERALEEIAMRGVSEPFEKEYIRKDGRRVPILIGGASFDERADSGVFFAIDLSLRRRAEAQLSQFNEELRETDRRKDEFLATLAHELRNPLAPIRNALVLLRRAEDNALVRESARDMMERQLQRMVRLIDDLLDISRINRGKIQLRLERVELGSVVQSAVEAARPFIDAQEHELTVQLPESPVYLDADPTRLAQVFANLLDNAAKYTEKGGHIWLVAERRDHGIDVSVRDTGIGIAAEHLPRLFEMFSQVAPALERSHGGLGIGLSLVRGLVSLHGGTVEARSSGLGAGSEFIVHLPVAEAPVLSPPTQDDTSLSASRRRVLVVDDNRDAADSMAAMLELWGHKVHVAYDGLEAVQTAASFHPDVVLLDIGLPRMNGYEAARHIREQPGGQDMVLVAVTGWGQEEDKRKARESGLDHHLTKPVDPDALEAVLAAGRS